MTRQELHTCDVCGAGFKVPEVQLRLLQVYVDAKLEFEHEICFECSQSLEKWILARRKEVK